LGLPEIALGDGSGVSQSTSPTMVLHAHMSSAAVQRYNLTPSTWTSLILVCMCYFVNTVRWNRRLLLLQFRGGIAQGVPYTATVTDLLCFPVWVLIIPDSSKRGLWQ
jgi:hypothetical protein